MSNSELPPGTDLVVWVPDGRGLPESRGDCVLLARDADRHYWIRSEHSTAIRSKIGKSQVELSPRSGSVELSLESPAMVKVSMVSLDGKTQELMKETRLEADVHPLRIPRSNAVQLIRAVVDGRPTTIAIQPNLQKR